MNIDFSYKVVNVVKENNFMEVEYSAEGYETVLVGMTIPKQNVNLDDYMKSYAPINTWVVSKLEYHDVLVGHSGKVEIERGNGSTFTDEEFDTIMKQLRN